MLASQLIPSLYQQHELAEIRLTSSQVVNGQLVSGRSAMSDGSYHTTESQTPRRFVTPRQSDLIRRRSSTDGSRLLAEHLDANAAAAAAKQVEQATRYSERVSAPGITSLEGKMHEGLVQVDDSMPGSPGRRGNSPAGLEIWPELLVGAASPRRTGGELGEGSLLWPSLADSETQQRQYRCHSVPGGSSDSRGFPDPSVWPSPRAGVPEGESEDVQCTSQRTPGRKGPIRCRAMVDDDRERPELEHTPGHNLCDNVTPRITPRFTPRASTTPRSSTTPRAGTTPRSARVIALMEAGTDSSRNATNTNTRAMQRI